MTLPELCIELEIRLFGTLLMSVYVVLRLRNSLMEKHNRFVGANLPIYGKWLRPCL